MRANRAEDGWGQTSRRAAIRPRPAVIALAVASVVVGWGTGVFAQEPLRWKFKTGETLRFSIEEKMVMDTKGMGVERKSNRTSTLDVTWKVLSVGAQGDAEITHRTERIRLRAEEPPFMPFDFDSAASKEPQPGFEVQARLLNAEVGAEFTFSMKPTGEITDIKVPEATLKKFRDLTPTSAPADEISEKALKETLMQASPPSFPGEALEPGKSWTARPARMPVSLPGPTPPLATLILDRTYTYQGPDPKSPELALVAVDTTARIEPIEGLEVKVAIRKQEGKGSMTVDTRAGRIVNTRIGRKLELSIAGKGQTIEQSTESSSSMTLVP